MRKAEFAKRYDSIMQEHINARISSNDEYKAGKMSLSAMQDDFKDHNVALGRDLILLCQDHLNRPWFEDYSVSVVNHSKF